MKTKEIKQLIADEREACAKICESMGALEAMEGEDYGSAAMVRVADRQAKLCAEAIRLNTHQINKGKPNVKNN
jgi:hypothetical protein